MEDNAKQVVTEVYITSVARDAVPAFRAWLSKLHQLESSFPGFKKTYVQAPKDEKNDTWITLLQFDTETHLDAWLNSSERQALLAQAEPFVKSQESHRLFSAFEGWFHEDNDANISSVCKQSMIVLLALFPVVMLVTLITTPYLTGVNLALAKFIDLAITVCIIAWPVMPLTLYLLKWWLLPTSKFNEYIGYITVILLYLIEVIIFYQF